MFSIVIPLYNKAHTIISTLQTVLNQTYTEFEVVVVNDGSSDNGAELIQKFTNDERIRVINQENQGVSVARNRGVKEAKNEWIAFLDGDDEWMPGFLEKIKEAIEKFPEASFYGTSSLHRNIKTGQAKDSTVLRYKNKIQVVDYFENPGVMPHTSAIVVSKKAFNSIAENGEGFPAGMKVCEDWSCFYRLAMVGNVVYIGYPLGIRNNNVEGQITNITQELRFKLYKHVVDFYNIVFQFWNKRGVQNNYIIFLKYDLRGRVLFTLKTKDYKTLNFLLAGLGADVKSVFPAYELQLYSKPLCRRIMMGYVYITKIMWRRHNYPIVGKNE